MLVKMGPWTHAQGQRAIRTLHDMESAAGQARPAARLADADGGHRPADLAAVRASRRRGILPAGHRRAGHRDRPGADARMVRAARRAVEARRRCLCVLVFLAIAIFAMAAIVYPGDRLGRADPAADRPGDARRSRRCSTSIPTSRNSSTRPRRESRSRPSQARTVRVETPNSMLGIITASAPHAAIQLFFALLVIYFFLAGWTGMRKRTIVSRGSFEGALTTARVIQQTVDATSTYIGTITVINVCLGGADRRDPVGAGHGFADHVGRHRRGAQLHPLSRPDRGGAAARARRADDLRRSLGGAAAAGDLHRRCT